MSGIHYVDLFVDTATEIYYTHIAANVHIYMRESHGCERSHIPMSVAHLHAGVGRLS